MLMDGLVLELCQRRTDQPWSHLSFIFIFFYFRQLTIYNLLAKLLSRGDLRITGVGHLFQRTLLTPHQDTNQRCQRTRQAYAAGKAKCDYFKTISEITQ